MAQGSASFVGGRVSSGSGTTFLAAMMRSRFWAHPAAWACAAFVYYIALLLAAKPVEGGDGMGLKGLLLAVFGFVALNVPFLGVAMARFARGSRRSSLLFHVFWLLVLFGTFFARSPFLSAVYVLMTFTVYFFAGNVWLAPRSFLRVMAGGVAIVCFAFCLKAALNLSLSPGRHLGYLTPNHFAAIALTPTLLAFVFRGWARLLLYATSIALISFVGARGAFVAWHLVVGINELARLAIHGYWDRLWRWGIVAVIAGSAAITVLLVQEQWRSALLAPVAKLLALDDPNRGFSSGFSGRTDHWSAHTEEIADHFVTGIGFRGARAGVSFFTSHNALLDLLKETGVVAAAVFVVFLALRLWQLLCCTLSTRFTAPVREMTAGVLAGICAVVFLAFFEAWLLNIGFPVGACALLFFSFYEPAASASAGDSPQEAVSRT